MAVLQVESLKFIANRILFKDVTFTFGAGDRIGLVGNNGAGKSTLLRCLAGLAEPTEGAVRMSKVAEIGYVGQQSDDRGADMSLRTFAVSAIPADDLHSLAWRADLLLERFGADDILRETPFRQLSGGWQRIGQIIRALTPGPDVLLLDEPTNSLDLEKTLRLEAVLDEEFAQTAMVIVSHDRRFLDRTTKTTLFLRSTGTRLIRDSFSRAREQIDALDHADQMKADRVRREADRLKRSAHNLRQIGISNFSDKSLRKSAQIQKKAASMLEALPESAPSDDRLVALASQVHTRKPVLWIEKADIGPPQARRLVRIDKLHLTPGERLVVLGRNGSGKTTFVTAIRDSLRSGSAQDSTGIRVHAAAVIGATSQHMTHLPTGESLHEFVASTLKVGNQRAPGLLAEAGFAFERQTARIGEISAGERARLAFLALRQIRPTLFLLDEPTNDLDIAGQEALETALRAQDAVAVLVSHDRAFVAAVGTRFIVLEAGKAFDIGAPDLFYRSLEEGVPVTALVPRTQLRAI